MSKAGKATTAEIAVETGIAKRTAERRLASLKKMGRIVRVGADKNGHWALPNGGADVPVNDSVNVPVNDPANVPANADALSESEEAVLSALATNPNLVREQLAEMLGKSAETVARALGSLKKKGRIVRVGPDKNGHWEITGGNTDGE